MRRRMGMGMGMAHILEANILKVLGVFRDIGFQRKGNNSIRIPVTVVYV